MANQATSPEVHIEWLVVVNRECAKVFTFKSGKLEFRKKIENPDGALRDREFQTDRPGRNHGHFAASGHVYSLDAGQKPSRDLELSFARHLADDLKRDFSQSQVTRAIVAAEPRMLGLLKAEIHAKMILTPIIWLQEDWVKMPNIKMEESLHRFTQRKLLGAESGSGRP